MSNVTKLKSIIANIQNLLLYNRGTGSTTVLAKAISLTTRDCITLNGNAQEGKIRYSESQLTKSFPLRALEQDGLTNGMQRSVVLIDPSFLMKYNEQVFDVVMAQSQRITELEQKNFELYQKLSSFGEDVELSTKRSNPLSPVKGLLTSNDGTFDLT